MKNHTWLIAVVFFVGYGGSAFAAGEYDGTYALNYGESKVLLSCGLSNFNGNMKLEKPLNVNVPAGEQVPEEVIEALLAQTYAGIQEYQLDPYAEYRAMAFADTFYDELQRTMESALAIYPDQMGVAVAEWANLPTPFFYVFDAMLIDNDTGWEVWWAGGMRTLAGAYVLYPYLYQDVGLIDLYNNTILGVSLGIQMAGIVDEATGALRWSTKVVAINFYTELILGCTVSAVAPHSIWLEEDEEPTPEPTPEPEATPDPGATPAPGLTPIPEATPAPVEEPALRTAGLEQYPSDATFALPSAVELLGESGKSLSTATLRQIEALDHALGD